MLALTFDSRSQTTSNQYVEYENPHRKMKEKFSTWAVIHSFRIYDLDVFLNVIAALPCTYHQQLLCLINIPYIQKLKVVFALQTVSQILSRMFLTFESKAIMVI